jgi:hypothetical protein
MSYPVTYYCPRCGTLVDLDREGYLDDKAVTPYPLEGWSYAEPHEAFEDADGVRFVCGEDDAPGVAWRAPPGEQSGTDPNPTTESNANATGAADATDDAGSDDEFDVSYVGFETGEAVESGGVGCGERVYLSFVRFENGEEVDPRRPSEQVELAEGTTPAGPGGPRGPREPDNSGGGFYE